MPMDEGYLPQTAEEYIRCFRQLASITNKSMDALEAGTIRSSREQTLQNLKRVAEAVETISSLRGDSGIFYDTRPGGLPDYQTEMYKTEDALRKRLIGLGYVYPDFMYEIRRYESDTAS